MSRELLAKLKKVAGHAYAFGYMDSRAANYRKRLGAVAADSTDYVAVALPGDVDSLQGVLRLAADENLTIACQPNAAANGLRLGAPRKQCLVLDLQRMNRILEVNADSAYALLETGVIYLQLYRHLHQKHLPMLID